MTKIPLTYAKYLEMKTNYDRFYRYYMSALDRCLAIHEGILACGGVPETIVFPLKTVVAFYEDVRAKTREIFPEMCYKLECQALEAESWGMSLRQSEAILIRLKEIEAFLTEMSAETVPEKVSLQ